MNCPYCGNEINDSASICPHCQNSVEGLKASKPKKKKHKNGLKVALVFVLILAISFGGYKGWGYASKNNLLPKYRSVKQMNETAVTVAMSNFKSLVVETVEYVNNNPIGGSATDINEAYEKVKGYRNKFVKLEGLPENVQAAGDEMYTLIYMAYKNSRDSNNYVNSIAGVLETPPSFSSDSHAEDASEEASEETSEDTSEDASEKASEDELSERDIEEEFAYLENFNSSLRTAYEEIKNVPPFFDWEHEMLGQSISLSENCVLDMKESYNNGSILDLYGSMNRFTHIWTGMNSCMEYYYNNVENQVMFYAQQRDQAYEIYSEFKNVFEMTDAEDIAAYEFKSVGKNTIKYEYDPISTIYPSLYNSYRYFLRLQIGSISGDRDIVVECQINGLTEKYKETIHVTDSLGVYAIKPSPDFEKASVDSSRDAQMTVSLSEKDGTLIDVQTFPVHIASKNEFNWEDDEFGFINKDNILCFLTPYSQSIFDLLDKTEEELADISGGNMTKFDSDEVEVYDEFTDMYFYAAAAMMALSDSGVRYNNDSFISDGRNQHILLPEEVLANKSGLCIETSLVIASLFKNAGFKTFILLPPGHAQVAVETKDGSGNYFLIETTMIPNNEEQFAEYLGLIVSDVGPENIEGQYPVMYYTTAMWADYLTQNNVYIINCDDVDELGITPFYD